MKNLELVVTEFFGKEISLGPLPLENLYISNKLTNKHKQTN
jgi:hypothetical protein